MSVLRAVPRYFFDTSDNGDVIRVDEGTELTDMAAVQYIAGKSLAELAHDVLPCGTRRRLRVDVRNAERELVLTTALNFQARIMANVDRWTGGASAGE